MEPPSITQGRVLACFIVLAQLAVSLLFGLFSAHFAGLDALISALIGGMTALIPQVLFSLYAFAWSGAQRAHKVMGAFYRGEALKMGCTVILMWIAFVYLSVRPGVFFSAYILALATVWLAPLVWLLLSRWKRR